MNNKESVDQVGRDWSKNQIVQFCVWVVSGAIAWLIALIVTAVVVFAFLALYILITPK